MKNNKNYPLLKPEPLNSVKEMLYQNSVKIPDKDAFRYLDNKEIINVTYKQFYLDTVYLGTALYKMEYQKKHVSCIGMNGYEWAVVFFTTLASNNVFIPIDKDLPVDDLINVVNHSESDMIFCDSKYEKIFEENKDRFEKDVKVISFSKTPEYNMTSYYDVTEQGKQLYESGDKSYVDGETTDKNELKMILYTSGTTGKSKGVMLTEKNIISCVYYGQEVSTVEGVGLSVLPYHHTYESVCGLIVGLHKNNTICINRSLKQVLKNFKVFKPDYVMLVPAFVDLFYKKIQKNLKQKGKDKAFNALRVLSNALLAVGIDNRRKFFSQIYDLFGGNIKKIVCGGAPISPDVAKFFSDIGITLLNGYGITECSPLVSCSRDYYNRFDTVGVVLTCSKVRIDNPNAEGIGEIIVKGDTVMLGYYKDPEKTAEVLKDGWFYTGDYGKYYNGDMLMITGRKKNLIVLSNGKNIFPEELEEYIGRLPEVKEVLVYCKKNENGEDKYLTAEVFLDEEAPISKDELKNKIADVMSPLPSYKQIKDVIIRDVAFEKTTSNKIKRHLYVKD